MLLPSLRPRDVRLFQDLTHLRLDVVPARPGGIAWQPWDLYATCPRNLGRPKHEPFRSTCHGCASRHLRRALKATHVGHCFRGQCGTRSFLMPLIGATAPVGLAALRESGERVDPGDAAGGKTGGAGRARAMQFHRAMLLLRVLAGGLRLRAELEQQREDLARKDRLLAYHEVAAERLRDALYRAIPSLDAPRPQRIEGLIGRERVHGLLEQVRREFTRPLTLTQLARERGMNSSYLSALFAREVGMPFKSYLTTLRLQRAQELLGNPRRRVSDVALEVGYASADRFRSAFRRWTGVGVSRWREIQRSL